MRTKLFALLISVLLASSSAEAHPGGHSPIDEKIALEMAGSVVTFLVEKDANLGFGKLEPTWLKLPDDATRIFQRGPGYYIVSVEHTKEARTLYILMSHFGEIYDANFTGKFEGID